MHFVYICRSIFYVGHKFMWMFFLKMKYDICHIEVLPWHETLGHSMTVYRSYLTDSKGGNNGNGYKTLAISTTLQNQCVFWPIETEPANRINIYISRILFHISIVCATTCCTSNIYTYIAHLCRGQPPPLPSLFLFQWLIISPLTLNLYRHFIDIF